MTKVQLDGVNLVPFRAETHNPPKSSILIGFGTIINHPFWDTPNFGNTHVNYPPKV